MEFNISKCFIMHISLARKNKILNKYTMDGKDLTVTSSTKYLGVTIASDLKWNIHIDNITAKATKVLNFIKRNLKHCPNKIKGKAFLNYVRPQLEFCSTVWDPHTKENIAKIEKVQRRAARFTMNNYARQASVTEMLKELNWPSLQERRMYFNVVMLYRIGHSFVAIPFSILPPLATHSYSTRSHHHNQQFIIPQCRINSYKHSFIPRTVIVWNQLQDSAICSTTTESFKKELSGQTLIP
jgi:hypothetical protein